MLVVWTLDRLSRSLRDVLTIMERVQERHAGFRSLKEAVDTTTPAGRMMMQMVGAFAEFERAMLKERTKAGLDAARKEGRIGGRPPKLKPHQQQEIVTLVKAGEEDRRRRGAPVRRPPGNGVAATPADLDRVFYRTFGSIAPQAPSRGVADRERSSARAPGGPGGFRLRDQEPEASHELQVDGPALLGTPGVGGASDRDGGVVAKRRGREPQPRVGIAGDGPRVRQSSCRHGSVSSSLTGWRRCAALWAVSARRGWCVSDRGSGLEPGGSRVQAGGEASGRWVVGRARGTAPDGAAATADGRGSGRLGAVR